MGARESTLEREPSLPRQGSTSMNESQSSYDDSMEPAYDDSISLFVAGCAASTSVNPLIGKFMGCGYGRSPTSNLESDFKIHQITVDDKTIELRLWNLYGVGYFGLSPIVFRRPHIGLMMLYDVGDERSFERAKQLITDAQKVCIWSVVALSTLYQHHNWPFFCSIEHCPLGSGSNYHTYMYSMFCTYSCHMLYLYQLYLIRS